MKMTKVKTTEKPLNFLDLLDNSSEDVAAPLSLTQKQLKLSQKWAEEERTHQEEQELDARVSI